MVTSCLSGTVLTHTAALSAPGDPDLSNNKATATSTAKPLPDFEIVTTMPPAVAAGAGQPIAFTVRLVNGDAAAFPDVVVHGELPAALTLVSATPSSGTRGAAGALDCRLGAVGAGQTATVSVVVTAAAAGQWTSSASAQIGTAHPAATVVITVAAPRRRPSGH